MPRWLARAWPLAAFATGVALVLLGRRLYHGSALSLPTRKKRRRSSQRLQLFLGNIPPTQQKGVKEALTRALRGVRGFRRVRLPKNSHGHHRGYAHVLLANAAAEDVLAAVADMGLEVGGRLVHACVLRPKDKRQVLFASVPETQRLALQLDSCAVFSTTDADTAQRMAEVVHGLVSFLHHEHAPESTRSVLDLCAGVGGNTFAFAEAFDRVVALEANATRREMLRRNLATMGATESVEVPDRPFGLDFLEDARRTFDVIFADPPWGGTQYSKTEEIPDLRLEGANGAEGADVSMTELCLAVAERRSACLLVLKLPKNFAFDALARRMTAPGMAAPLPPKQRRHSLQGLDERPFPFRMEFGVTQLLIVGLLYPPRHLQTYDVNPFSHEGPFALQPRRAEPHSYLVCENSKLDGMVASIRRFNAKFHQEHHPRFWDWERERWIPLSRWKGYNPEAPPKKDGPA